MKTMEMSQNEQDDLFAIVASVLHMGNVGFTEEDGVAQILKPASVDAVATVSTPGMLSSKERNWKLDKINDFPVTGLRREGTG